MSCNTKLERFDWIRGTDLAIQVWFPNQDLTGGTIHFTGKIKQDTDADDSTAAIVVDWEPSDIPAISALPASGVCVLPISAEKLTVAPKEYYCDVKLETVDGRKVALPTFLMNIILGSTNR